ncbi:MAG: thiamine phosphate synthase, partial [Saezia sp.]
PILRASTGKQFADDALRQAMLGKLLPRATMIKPNLKEAFWLVTGQEKPISEIDASQMPHLAAALREMGAGSVVITGGDYSDHTGADFVMDWLDTAQVRGWLSLPAVHKGAVHGTGCTFTASAAAVLALGFCEADAAILAKMATTGAVQNAYKVGAGEALAFVQSGFALQPDLLPCLTQQRFDVMKSFVFPALSDGEMGLYAIVDSSAWVRRVIDAGVKTVQLRIKAQDARIQGEKGRRFLSEEIRCSSAYAKAKGVQFFVNDHWQLALEHGAYGVHLGQEDLPNADLNALRKVGMRLGVSTYSLWDVCIAKTVAPSYYACGPIYETQSKELPWLTQGIDNLAYFSQMLDRPVVAIGGIDRTRICDVVRGGAKGIAVISAIMGEANPELAIAQLQQEIVAAQALPKYSAPKLPHNVL